MRLFISSNEVSWLLQKRAQRLRREMAMREAAMTKESEASTSGQQAAGGPQKRKGVAASVLRKEGAARRAHKRRKVGTCTQQAPSQAAAPAAALGAPPAAALGAAPPPAEVPPAAALGAAPPQEDGQHQEAGQPQVQAEDMLACLDIPLPPGSDDFRARHLEDEQAADDLLLRQMDYFINK